MSFFDEHVPPKLLKLAEGEKTSRKVDREIEATLRFLERLETIDEEKRLARRAYYKAWREKNKQRLKEYERERYLENAPFKKVRARRYHASHRAEQNARRRERRAARREAENASARAYYAKNCDKIIAVRREKRTRHIGS